MSKPISTPNEASFVPNTRMAGEERRDQLLRVAMSLFSNHGFRGTTTKEIAHAAGVSEAMVFRHFATKEDLYAAILDHKACSGGGSFDPKDYLGIAQAFGATAVLPKPFRPAELVDVVSQLLAQSPGSVA